MASKVDICNLALMKVGAESITALTDSTKRAKLCNKLFTPTLERVIKHHNWLFATKRFTLSNPSSTTPIYGFQNRFALPDDIYKIIELEQKHLDWRVENGFLLTDAETVNLKAITVEEDVDLYEDFKEVMALHLAVQLAYPIVQSVSLKNSLIQELRIFEADARGVDSQEGTPESLEPNDIIDARFSGLRTIVPLAK